MNEVIVRLTADHIKVKGGEYVRDYQHGEWEEKETFHNGDGINEPIIEEWQSAKCSICGKYHTTPYMYYFDNYNFCPNCGADMRKGAADE